MSKDNKKQTTFETPTLTIAGNGIDCQDTFIHTRNITQIWIGQIPKKPMPMVPIIVLLAIGFGLFNVKFILGLIPIAIAIAIIFINYNQVTLYGMNIELSSGRIYSFTSSKRNYLEKAYDCIKNIINRNLQVEYKVNLNSGTINTYNFDNNTINSIKDSTVGSINNK